MENQKISQVVEPKDFQVQNLGVRIFMPNERLQATGGEDAALPPTPGGGGDGNVYGSKVMQPATPADPVESAKPLQA